MKAKQNAKFTSLLSVSRYKMLSSYISNLISLWRFNPLHVNTLRPLWMVHYCAESGKAEGNQLLGNAREIQWYQVNKVVTVIKHRGTAGEW